MEMYRCPGCMDVTANTVCEKCGWPMGKNNEVHQLPVGTRLRGQYVIGRMGVPYQQRGVSIISVAVDAPGTVISALSGKLGRLKGVTAKTVYAPEDALN